jgi:hypothetical protein
VAIGDNNNDGVLSSEESSALQVNLTLYGVNEVLQMQDLAANLQQTVGVDAVEFNLMWEGANHTDDLIKGLTAVQNAGMETHGVINGSQASALIDEGFSFNEGNHIEVVHDYAQGTHLSNSLKELQKLGVDAVAVSGGVTVSLGDGAWGINTLPVIGDLDMNGVLSTEERTNTNVTLEATFNNLEEVLLHASDLVNHVGVDAISLNISSSELNSLADSLTAQANTLSALEMADLSANAINVDGANYASVAIDQGLAQTLINGGLHFAAEDHIDLHATGTFIQNGLKDLQKLGVDSVTLNASTVADITNGSIPSFSALSLEAGITVNLEVATSEQLNALGTLAQSNQTDGWENSLSNLTGIRSIELAGDSTSLQAMLSSKDGSLAQTIASVQTLRWEGFSLDTIDVSGSAIESSFTITDAQANELVSAGLHFESADHITLETTGTHLQTSLRELQRLGVDSVATNGSTLDINLGYEINGFGSSLNGMTNLGGDQVDVTLHAITGNLPTFLWHVADENADLKAIGIDHVQLGYSADNNSALTDVLSQLGVAYTGNPYPGSSIDILHKSGVDLELNGRYYNYSINGYSEDANVRLDMPVSSLIEAGVHFALDDVVTINASANASGTHITTSLKDLQKLGVDFVGNTVPNGTSNSSLSTYTDWKLGVTKDFGGGLSGALAYVGTNAATYKGAYTYTSPSGKNLGQAGGLISLTKTF